MKPTQSRGEISIRNGSMSETPRIDFAEPGPATIGGRGEPNSSPPRAGPRRDSVLGKRTRGNNDEDNDNYHRPRDKRHSQDRDDTAIPPPDPSPGPNPNPLNSSSTDRLCVQCSSIRWNIVDDWINYEGRFDLFGKIVAHVGTYYRQVSPYSSCPLCRQLGAPWIEDYLRNEIDDGREDDGDTIHIFRHLRHLPHVNDYQTAMNVLRTNNAPYHIAVVPSGRGWKDQLRQHIADRGMVVVMPTGYPDSKIFVPQQVSKKFDPKVVSPWLKFCKRHKKLCTPEVPDVQGLKMIDCESEGLVIRKYSPGDRYVALSYVWGDSGQKKPEPPTPLPSSKPETTTQQRKPLAPSKASLNSARHQRNAARKIVPLKNSTRLVKQAAGGAPAPKPKPLSKLPEDIPLTIKDAIQVTKSLNYRYLWVDKYCIDQNNDAEKQQQFSRMGDIYSGAELAIFALGPGSDYGLPGVSTRDRKWEKQSTTIGRYKFLTTMPDPHVCIKTSKWSTRAWTYQEGLFSTRRLFFTDYQAYFECNAMNSVEAFKSNLKILHIRDSQRFRAYHRAGRFVCGNSNPYSHLNVKQSRANHRKIDTLRRCQYQLRQYTKRELTNKDDILNAFAGIARFYARSNARIASLAGVAVPAPIARLPDVGQEGLDYLSYALAWTHHMSDLVEIGLDDPLYPSKMRSRQGYWTSNGKFDPKRRAGFPSWSWAGWFGEVGRRQDLPYHWTSHLGPVTIGFGRNEYESYSRLQWVGRFKQYLIRRLLTAKSLRFDAYLIDPNKLMIWKPDPRMPTRDILAIDVTVSLSTGTCSLRELHQKLLARTWTCLVLGTHGEPRREIFRAIQAGDKKSAKAQKKRIELFECQEPTAIICLIVQTRHRVSERVGLLKIQVSETERDSLLKSLTFDNKENFILV